MIREEIMGIIDKIWPFGRPEGAQPEPRSDATRSFWANPLTGLGETGADKATWHAPGSVTPIATDTLAALWIQDSIARMIVEAIVDDGLKEGFVVQYNGESDGDLDLVVRVQQDVRAVDLEGRIRLASKCARALGGAALLLLDERGQRCSLDQPTPGGRLERIIIADPRDLIPMTWDLDEPESYIWAPSTPEMMEVGSRGVPAKDLIILEGMDTLLRDRRLHWRGWYRPVLQHVVETIRDFRSSWQSSVAMLQDGSQKTLSLPGLSSLLVEGGRVTLQHTLAMIQARSWVGRIMPIDSTEKLEVVSRSYAGISEMLRTSMPLVCQAADMPITRFFGESPKGLGSTGKGESDNWLSTVQSHRRTKVEWPTVQIIRIMAVMAGAEDPDGWGLHWPSLEVVSAKVRAETEKLTVETDALRIAQGVPKETVSMHRYGGSEYDASPPTLTEKNKDLLQDPEAAAGPVDPAAALTGVQTSEMRGTLLSVAQRRMPRESGVEALLLSLPIDRPQAERLMGSVGREFFIEDPGTEIDPPPDPEIPID